MFNFSNFTSDEPAVLGFEEEVGVSFEQSTSSLVRCFVSAVVGGTALRAC